MLNAHLQKLMVAALTLFTAPGMAGAVCDQTLNPGVDLATAIANAAEGTSICLSAGDYGAVEVVDVHRSTAVRIESVSAQSASLSLTLWNAAGFEFRSLTIAGLRVDSGTKNIAVVSSKFTGQAVLRMDGVQDANVLLDGNSFDNITVCDNCYEGRLQIMGGVDPVGVTVSNSHFGGGGGSDGIQLGAPGVIIGPGNVFEDIVQGGYARHIDAIQGYGQRNTTITGNYFTNNTIYVGMYDGGANETITQNVFGPSPTNEQKLQLGSIQGLDFIHNTVKGAYLVAQGAKNGDSRNIDAVFRNNLFDGTRIADTGDQPGCASGCVYENNLFSSSQNARGSDTIIGSPTYSGGPSPSSKAGYQLTSSSLGFRSGSDGLDLGATFDGVGSLPSAPTNLRVVQ